MNFQGVLTTMVAILDVVPSTILNLVFVKMIVEMMIVGIVSVVVMGKMIACPRSILNA